MSDFAKAVAVVLKHEGGLVDHPDDPGGITNYGISLRWAMKTLDMNNDGRQDADIDGDGDVDSDDIRLMQRDDAIMLYRMYWWEKYRYWQISVQAVATKVFDMAVNMGPARAHMLVQQALAAAGQEVKVDGILGPKTMRAIADASCILPAIRAEQAGFYRSLIARSTALRECGRNVNDLAKFEKGWLRRAYDL